MNELGDLLEIIVVPPTDAAADVARGEQRLRRRRRTQAAAAAACVAAVATLAVSVSDGPGASGSSDRGFTGPVDTASSSSTPRADHGSQTHRRFLADRRAQRETRRALRDMQSPRVLQGYYDVLAEHLDPAGAHLRPAQNQQSGGSILGTKLDWNGGGMLQIVVGRSWGAAGSFYLLENAGLRPTTYDGQPARVSTTGDDLVVSVQHDDGTVVTLIASTSFGNNGTSTADLGLTQRQLLGAAADPRLVLPDGMP